MLLRRMGEACHPSEKCLDLSHLTVAGFNAGTLNKSPSAVIWRHQFALT